MTPRPLDEDVVRSRLAELVRVCGWLGELGTPDEMTLERDWRTRLLAGRLLQQCVELSVSVNLHVTASLSRPVTGYRESFLAMAAVGRPARRGRRATEGTGAVPRLRRTGGPLAGGSVLG